MITNPTTNPPWIDELKEGIFKKHIQLVIFSYAIIKEKRYPCLPKENTRRNTLIRAMRKHKNEFGVLSLITSESALFDDDDEDVGRMDITCYFDSMSEDRYIAFECKRFLKKDIIPSYFHSQFVNEGLKRFQDNKYSTNMPVAGTISFFESGDYNKAHEIFIEELPKICVKASMIEQSAVYHHDYVFSTVHSRTNNNDIKLTHILLDFTHNTYSVS